MPSTSSSSYDAAILGLKLTAGAEMLLAQATADVHDHKAPSGPAWDAFEAALVDRGYFHSQLPGSAAYTQRLQEARAAFAATPAGMERCDAPAARARALLQALPSDMDAAAWRAREHGPLCPADDDAWMRDGAADLEAELAGRQAERDAHEATRVQVAERVAAFVAGEGGLEGAEVPESLDLGVDVSMDAVLRELQAALGVGEPGGGRRDDDQLSSEEGSSFFSDPDSGDDDEEDATPAAASGSGEPTEGHGFFAAYLDELESQLRSTTVPNTFSTGDEPVDVDANLVANLLASVDMQQGLAGPASNLAGMVGLKTEKK